MKLLPERETPTKEEQSLPSRRHSQGSSHTDPTTRRTTQAPTSQRNPVTSETDEEDQKLDGELKYCTTYYKLACN